MTTHTEQPETTRHGSKLVLLEALPAPVRLKDDWRLSRTAKPLRTWRLSK